MSISRGTLVRPYNSDEGAHTCKGGVCVGRVVIIDIGDEPFIMVKWLERCDLHNSDERFGDHNLEDLWEIGQI